MKKDIVIEIIEIGREDLLNRGKGISTVFIREELKKKGYVFDTSESSSIIWSVINSSFEFQGGELYKLKIDAYFSFLEYEELQDARKSSKQANRWAIAALTVSLIGSGISIYYSKKQLETPTEIKQEQIDSILSGIRKKD